MEQNAQVARYFDLISSNYRARYAAQNPYHNFFFRQRLKAATDGIVLDGKSVLDIGAGTGALYDELIERFSDVDYFGCDISCKMLAQSNIPVDRAFVGRAHEIELPRQRFDYIFLLGVTTYQDPQELTKTWRFIADRLAPNGAAIITFTNRASVDHVLRSMMSFAKPVAKGRVFGQSFATHAYSMREVEEMARVSGLRVTRSAYLNQTFFPFSSLVPMPSVAVARLIGKHVSERAMPPLSADFLIFAEREAS